MMMLQTYRYVFDFVNRGHTYNLAGFQFKLRRPFPSKSFEFSRDLLTYIHNCFTTTVVFIVGPSSPVHTENLASLSLILPTTYISQASTRETKDKERLNRQKSTGYFLDYTFQTVPSDHFRFTAVYDLIRQLGWNYMIVLASISLKEQAIAFVRKDFLNYNKICLDSLVQLESGNVYQSVLMLKTMVEHNTNLKVLVLFTDDRDSWYLLKALKELKLDGRFRLVFPYGAVNNVESVRGYEDVAVGSLSVEVTNFRKFKNAKQKAELDAEEAEYRKHLLELTPDKEKTVFFHLYWEQTFECRLKSKILEKHLPNRNRYNRSCDGSEEMQIGKNLYPNMGSFRGTIQSMKGAAYTYQLILDSMPVSCNKSVSVNYFPGDEECAKCLWKFMRCIRPMFRNLIVAIFVLNGKLVDPNLIDETFPRPNASYEYYNFQPTVSGYMAVPIGNWSTQIHEGKNPTESMRASKPHYIIDTERIMWKNSTTGVTPYGNCSKECDAGSIRVYEQKNLLFSRCCWKCSKCPKNSIVRDNVCKQCDKYQRADNLKGMCRELSIHYISIFSDASGWALGVPAVFGIILVLAIAVVYVVNNDKRVIKSSGRDMSYAMLFGTLALFLTTFLFTSQPNEVVCSMRDIVPSLALLTCFMSLLMKNLRLYRIFEKYRTKLTQPKMISPTSQIIVLLGGCGFQTAISFTWMIDGGFPGRQMVLSDNGQYVILRCEGGNYGDRRFHFLLNNLLSIICIIFCSILSYKLRNLPKNYNQSKGYMWTAFILLILLGMKTFCS